MYRKILAVSAALLVGIGFATPTIAKAPCRGGLVHLHSLARLLSGAAAGFMPLREAVG